jgi:hypothetical protein
VNSLAISITAVTVQQVLGLQWAVGVVANRRRRDKSDRDREFEMANERSIAHAQAAQ